MSRRTPRQKILFICGSLNQTTQMHQVAAELPEHDRFFTPYYCTGLLELARRRGLLEMTIAGNKLATRCLSYLESQDLRIDPRGELGDYDLVVTCSDQVIPGNVIGRPIVLVQEGILDPITPIFHLARLLPIVPRWLAGTAATGQSNAFRRFCVASEGYRRFFERHGVDAAKIVVTAIPNFDDCRRYLVNGFPHRDYVLAYLFSV